MQVLKSAFSIVLVLFLGKVTAQTATDAEPGARNKPGFVYDSERQKFVLFGGYGKRGEGIRDDTWEWDGKVWRQVIVQGPAKRGAMGMVYDSNRKKTVLFGGAGDSEFSDTWEFDGEKWRHIDVAGPPARSVPAMVYDSRQEKIILFGGFDNTNKKLLGDTWEWNGVRWKQLSSTGPQARFHHAMVYDSIRGTILLFGGNQAATPPPHAGLFGDTWEWDGKQWTKLSESGPLKRDHHGMCFDVARGKAILFGGWNTEFLGDAWAWDGREWAEIKSAGPSARGGVPSMAYDNNQKKVILFGG